ncbi:MAG: hypothetical protein HUK26_08985, partial [Duodenibacillus sp.]|nr:hypothetical protein [Duodenibacillus sp.]
MAGKQASFKSRARSVYASLSTRLLVLTVLWVTFVICTIGYTMFLDARQSEAAETVAAVTAARAQTYRASLLALSRAAPNELGAELQ